MVVGDQHHAPAALPLGKRLGTHVQEVGWAPESVQTGAENFATTGIRPWTSPASYAIPAHEKVQLTVKFLLFIISCYTG